MAKARLLAAGPKKKGGRLFPAGTNSMPARAIRLGPMLAVTLTAFCLFAVQVPQRAGSLRCQQAP